MATCIALRKDGQTCGAAAVAGTLYCFMHSEDQTLPDQARLQGGLNRKVEPLPSECPVISSVDDLLLIANEALKTAWSLQGERRVKGLADVGRLLRDILPIVNLDKRLADVEDLLNGNPKQNPAD